MELVRGAQCSLQHRRPLWARLEGLQGAGDPWWTAGSTQGTYCERQKKWWPLPALRVTSDCPGWVDNLVTFQVT